MATDQQIIEALNQYKKIAVVGLSPNPGRPSHGVSAYMQANGYEITPVRPGGVTVFGIPSVDTLDDVPRPLEIVNVFRRSEFVPEITEQAIKGQAKVLWLQEGVFDPVSEEKARKAGLLVISDRCILKEHRRLL